MFNKCLPTSQAHESVKRNKPVNWNNLKQADSLFSFADFMLNLMGVLGEKCSNCKGESKMN